MTYGKAMMYGKQKRGGNVRDKESHVTGLPRADEQLECRDVIRAITTKGFLSIPKNMFLSLDQ